MFLALEQRSEASTKPAIRPLSECRHEAREREREGRGEKEERREEPIWEMGVGQRETKEEVNGPPLEKKGEECPNNITHPEWTGGRQSFAQRENVFEASEPVTVPFIPNPRLSKSD